MPPNAAAWLVAPGANPLVVKSAPYTRPHDDQIVIRNGAVAINPIDWIVQDNVGVSAFPWIEYPHILGTDVAGEVVEVGRAVTRFKVGDRVVGYAVGSNKERNTSTERGFQLYTVLLEHMTSPIPSTLSYEAAAVIPLGASTAACGMFQEDQLALQTPSYPARKPTGKTLIVWGGSTSVGSNAIQLGVAAGYEVITTASPKNFEYVKRLGASQVFDYNSKTVVADMIHACKGKTVVGALTMGHGAADACMDILPKCQGKNKFISMASYPLPQTTPKHFVVLTIAAYYVSWNIANWIKCRLRGIRTGYIFASTLANNGVGKAIYSDFLPGALENGTYIAAPELLVVGKGLEYFQEALTLQKKGVSAKKVVVSL